MLDKKNDIDVMWAESNQAFDDHPHFGKYSQSGGAAQDSQVRESDPFGKNPKEKGSKLDAGKSPVYQGLLDYFPLACLAVADVSRLGALKYAWKGWETVPDGFNRYSNALGRHLLKRGVDTTMKDEKGNVAGILHEAEAAWNAMARLELLLKETK